MTRETFGEEDLKCGAAEPEGRHRQSTSLQRASAHSVVIASTFTADLLERPLEFWMGMIEIAAHISIAPYAQLMQGLLDPQSQLSQNKNGFNVLLLRPQDWIRDRLHESVELNLDHVRRAASDLMSAVGVMRARSAEPLLTVFCPPSHSLPEVYVKALEDVERELMSKLAALPNSHCWGHADLMRLYPVAGHEDARADRIAHIPYTSEYYVAIATLLARWISALLKPQCKVIAIDCDNTLWRGVCGEDGAAGVQVTPGRLALQRLLIQQHDAGVLLCLCSKNNPADVEAVFATRREMPLRKEHFISSRVNWNRKSENLRSIAKELDLGLDSFVLIDDSGLECAEVQAGCPEVTTLCVPQTEDELQHFVNHVWAFDCIGVTEEAKGRAAQYRQNRQRNLALKDAGSLEQFIASLQLKVQVSPMLPGQLARVAELTQRTNQFNLSGIRRRASEIEALCNSGEMQSLVVHVQDRFGDYGLVGAVFLRSTAAAIAVDTFVLSCRVLGRGVEYRVLNEIGKLARQEGRADVLLNARETQRNAPSQNFLEKQFGRFAADGPTLSEKVFTVPADYAEKVDARMEDHTTQEDAQPQSETSALSAPVACWQAAAYRLSRIPDIVRAIARSSPGTERRFSKYVAPRTPTEEAVASIWKEILRVEKVGVHDDFFDLGGDSLSAVQMIARIGSVLDLELPLHEIFDTSTVEEVAAKLTGAVQYGPKIERTDRSRAVPLSWAQQRLWFIDQLEHGSAAYHVPVAINLRGEVDGMALREALDALIERHEALRTVFVKAEGGPVQRIVPRARFALRSQDLHAASISDRKQEVLRQSQRDLATPFDLNVGPLIRGSLLRLSQDEHVLLITMHHMVSDGWSIGVLIRELAALYEACHDGNGDPLPPLPIQYADYAQWQQDLASGPQMQTQLKYWTKHLQGAPQVLELPLDRPRPPTQSYRGANVSVVLDADLTADLRGLSRQLDLTLAMTLYTGWSILLSRLTGQEDIITGMPIANRRRTEIEGLIGFFVNTLAVRVRMDDDPPVVELLRRVKEVMLEAYANQDAPFEKVVESVLPARSLSHSPIFQVMFALQAPSRGTLESDGLTIEEQEVPLHTAQFDLLLSLQESPDGLRGTLNYASDLFEAATIERWVAYLRTVLHAMVYQAHRKVSALPLLSGAERRLVLESFNPTPAWFAQDKLIHELFDEVVQRSPQALAVVYEEESLTYAELSARANQLARYLRAQGVELDELVGICVERSIEMVVGLLGILKAGGAYVPLDPTYPLERLQYMIENAAPRVLLTQERLKDSLMPLAKTVLALDSGWNDIARYESADLDPRAIGLTPRNLAYVIYTSGSTGRPKGAMNEHRALVNRLQWMQDQYQLDPSDSVLQKTPFSFDVSVWEFFWTLLNGARLIVARPHGHQDPAYMRQLIEATEVTTVHFVPSMLQIFLVQQRAGGCRSLRRIVCSGEELTPALQNRCLEYLPHARLSNLYGPTEAAIDVTAWECQSPERGSRVPIGRPITNTQMYVLDRHMQPVPAGVVGEIYIGGVGVGRGYWKRPELTAERFLPDAFNPSPQARIYRTGDLGRWRNDGAIEYLGRNDNQVKIRGLRIELGEIEAQLLRHPQVKEAVVLARDDRPGEKRLVAYVTSRDCSGVSAEQLRSQLKVTMPDYMVPSGFVILQSFPLSPNGKLDRRALPAPQMDAYVSRDYEAPRGEVEEILAGIWQTLLGVERVGRHDNFFEMGGHSLLIVQMMDRLRRRGLVAELRVVFESPTLMDLAKALTSAAAVQGEVPPNSIPPGCNLITPQMLPLVQLEAEHIERIAQAVSGGAANIQDIYPLAPLQEGILFHHLFDEGKGDVYVVPMVLSVSSEARLQELIEALQRVIDRHDVLRTAVMWEQLPRSVQVVYRHARLPVERINLHGDPGEQIKQWMAPERQRFDLRVAPLLRLRVAVGADNGECYALLQFHHIVGDNTAQEIVISEVVASLEGRAQALPPSVPYRNHVAQVLAYAGKHDAESFFRSKLADVDEPTAPFGLQDVHLDASLVEEGHEGVDPVLAQRVRVQARRLGVSAATLFHAAWSLVVAHTTGRDDVVFGTVLLGRLQGDAGAQRILGMFINTLPLRLKLRGVTAKELIEQTQRELMELLMHEQASLAVAQRCSAVPATAPLFSALLNYRHNAPNPDAQWSSAAGVRVVATQDRTNYPMTVSVDDLGEQFRLTCKTEKRVDPLRVTGYLRTAMHSLVQALEETSQAPALALPILPEEERRQLELLNATKTQYPQHALLHEVFEEQVRRTPEAIAVVCDGHALSFAQLNAKANQLARYLQTKGVEADQPVALCIDRSTELVLGMLGILKAGGAYVPLDPEYPAERLRHMLEDCAPRLVLTREALKMRLPHSAAEVVAVDDERAMAAHQTHDVDTRTTGTRSDRLAYVIYTSGSTGRPKGVMVEHRNVLSLWQGLEVIYQQAAPCQRVAVNASFSFDASVKQFVQLLSGRTIVLIPQEARWDAARLLDFLSTNQVEGIDCTPSQLRSWLVAGLLERDDLALKVVLVGGEPIDVQLWNELAHSSRVSFYNVYGPTESTVDATFACLNGDFTAPHIGRPMQNRCVYILGQHGMPLPIGVTGEMYIGGAGIARGYLNRSDLTQEKFVAAPCSVDTSDRMYKTGDLARWRPDGNLEYVGRNDHQVKIRGFRIELGEIETQLLQHARVKEAVVVAREDSPGHQRLVAYVTQRDHAGVSVDELRKHLSAVLPEYMAPSAFVVLASLPLTPSGKLDRRALPEPEVAADREYEPAQGAMEEVLAGIWKELLRVEQVGRHDNFFVLGGHSLLIMQMMERLRRLGLPAEVRRIFESASLADMARLLTGAATRRVEVPANLIPRDCEHITPQMLPLVQLEPKHIECIIQAVPGGAGNIQDIYPLAPLQEGILFHHMMSEGSGDTYVLPTLLSVPSREHVDALLVALQVVVDRHDVLRTAMIWDRLPRPVQVVYRRATLPVEEVVLDSACAPLEQVRGWLTAEHQWIDLRRAPLMRVKLAASPQGQWYVLLQRHHIVCDHVTLESVICEVVAHVEGCEQTLPPSMPYRSHVAQTMAYGRTDATEAFFRSKLEDIQEPTAPFGLLDVHGGGNQVAEACKELEPDLALRARAQARRLGVSAATLFHAAWGLVVAQTSGRDDVVFGSVLLGRLQGGGGAERTLGMYINTLPMRLRLDNVTAKELVQYVQRELVQLLSHEHASLAVAQRCSGIVGTAPLFTTLFNYRHSVPNSSARWSGMKGVQVLAVQERTNYPITLSVDDLGEGFNLKAQTDCRVQPQRIADCLHEAVQSLVDALENAPQTPALTLASMPRAERQQVIELFNSEQASQPSDKLIHEMFEQQVRRTPHVTAVTYDGQSLTYAQLNAGANQLARYLHDCCVGPDQLVGICVERSLEMVVGVLAVLKAGGAYVPLDPNYPPDRLHYMLKDSAPVVVLTQEKLKSSLPPTEAEVIALDGGLSQVAGYDDNDVSGAKLGSTGQNLLYVIYTSGSTGQPKGTAMPHCAMANLIEWHRRNLGCSPGQRVLQFAALSFDVAFQETFSTLCTGGTLVLLDEWIRRDVRALLQLLRDHQIERLFVPPLMLQNLAEYFGIEGGGLDQLRDVIVAGEQLRISPQITSFFKQIPGCRLHNHYGPTETHVVTTLTLADDPSHWPMLPSIGRPISNSRIYVLNKRHQPVPIGAVGGVYVGGAGIARAYLKRPQLTAERFIRDPFSSEPGARMYETGDLCCWRTDGTLEYLGRNDDQVKVRGFRIELGEIEARLMEHPRVKDAAVVAREQAPGVKRLVAYITTSHEGAAGVEEMREHVNATLPEYMVPSAFVTLQKLPVTPSGKLNRRALPEPDLNAYANDQYEAPQGEVEQALVQIWRELLLVQRIGRHDNFFELGGQSLLAMQLVVRIQSSFSVEIPIRSLFEAQTVKDLARRLEELQHARLLEKIVEGGDEVEGLIEQLASMSESKAKELLSELSMEVDRE